MGFLYYLRFLIVVFILTLASYEDIKSRTISNRLIICGCILGIILVSFEIDISVAFDALMGFLVGGGILLIIAYISKGGIGMGDVKLMSCIGICLGIGRTLGTLMMAIICSGIFAAVILLINKSDKRGTIPFAPFILLGTLIVFWRDFV